MCLCLLSLGNIFSVTEALRQKTEAVMSADQQTFPSLLSPSLPPGAVKGFGGVDPLTSPPAEMETLKMFLNERLTAAIEDILGVFGKTVARYREQIDCQQRQLESLRSGEGEWSPAAGRFVPPENCGETSAKLFIVRLNLLHL